MSNVSDAHVQAFVALVNEVRTAFHRFGRAADHLHRDLSITAAERAVLVELFTAGPHTVPAMASARPVSRPHIQTIVNELLDKGLVQMVDNPRHQRSHLVQLTPTGRSLTRALLAKESVVLASVAAKLNEKAIRNATQVIREAVLAVEAHELTTDRRTVRQAQRRSYVRSRHAK